ncbi:hypothetical protein OIZ54_00785 [Pseudoalteromonas sp. A3]|uniref:hypothetical protein n=1 Tax=Pseudoalteromonas sp. A3 TaxID=142792 RepID=UPI00221E42DA|nr:hypothetical protein [Pseudoalteromonas sp. A3]MCW1717275.1 hypothetical protein [Pseudoalteromonas sp. A3]
MQKEDYYSSLGSSARDWVDLQQAEVNRSLKVWAACSILAILSPMLAFLLVDTSTNLPQWFQRSGTLLLVFSLLAEIKAQVVRKSIFVVDANRLYCHLHIESKNKKWMPFVQYFTYFLVAVGTLITGYGDIIFNKICNM